MFYELAVVTYPVSGWQVRQVEPMLERLRVTMSREGVLF